MRIQFILEVFVYRQRLWEQNILYGHFLWTDMPPGFVPLLTVVYFHSYLNQMPQPISHSSYRLRIARDWQILIQLFRWAIS